MARRSYNLEMLHQLLCCSDTHGRPPPLADESNSIAWLHGGDICNGWDKPVMEAARQAGRDRIRWQEPVDAAVESWFSSRSVPVYVVRGNHDVVDPYRAFTTGTDLSGSVIQLSERLFVAGVGWSGQYHFDLPLEEQLEPVCHAIGRQLLRRLGRNDRLILLSHYPAKPAGQTGGTASYACIRQLAEEFKPSLVVQGHIHSWFGTSTSTQFGDRNVLFVNPGPNGLEVEIDMDTASARIVRYLEPNPWFVGNSTP